MQTPKQAKLKQEYSFISTNNSLVKGNILRGLINDIDNQVNSFARTYTFYDILGQFYIEFLKYSNSDKGLGIVLTPPHITEFFCKLVNIKTNDIVYDNCAGTSGFLVSAMKSMIKKSKGNGKTIDNIKQNQLYGVEYQSEIYPLAVSNMLLHGDGKSNIFDGSCFDEDIIQAIKEKKPTVGFLNPPYKSGKEEFEFVLNNLEQLEKKGLCVAIVPMSCVLAKKRDNARVKRKVNAKTYIKGSVLYA